MGSIYVNLLFLMATAPWVDKIAGNFVDLQEVTEVIVNTTEGEIRGTKSCIRGKMATWFLGVPYAKPPIDELRLQPPVEMGPWKGIKDATSAPNACPQVIKKIPGFEAFTVNTNTSEDCLYLNVFVPSDLDPQARLPVMVWLHGGGFTGGSSTLEAYDGRYLALQSQAIIVTVNYRLGFLGFMKLGEIRGNFGLLDQRIALGWVRVNIAKFGGDPKKVTLFGQSAGASSVSLHLVSEQSYNYFQKAIMQSGSFLSPWSFVDVDTAEKRSRIVVSKLKCNRTKSIEMVACLMEKSTNEILEAQNLGPASLWWFVPTIDGTFITDEPRKMLANVRKKKPILFGSTHDEGSLFTSFTLQKYLFTQNLTDADQRTELTKLFYYYPYYKKQISDIKLGKILQKYSPSGDQFFYNFNSITTSLSDSWFVCPTNEFASLYKSDTAYNYLFTQTLPKKLLPTFGSTHGLDLLFSFSTIIKYRQLGNFTENDIKLSEQIISFWSNFARNGNPNFNPSIGNYSTWPKYTPDQPKYLTLNGKFLNGEKADVDGSFRSDFCSFWKKCINVED